MSLELAPCSLRYACNYVRSYHRHHRAPVGGLFAVACASEGVICGVAIVGRPVARLLNDGFTAEVTRLATDGTKNACSVLYGACRRAARALGFRRLITYTLATESGVSLRAAGWKETAKTRGGTWSRPSRERTDKHPVERKIRWEAAL